MAHIKLTNEQLRIIVRSREPIAIHDEDGKLHGYIAMIVTDDELAAARKALSSGGPRYTTAEVVAKLRAQAAP